MSDAVSNWQPIFWVTRTEPDNANTSARLHKMGLCALAVPVLGSCAVRAAWPMDIPDVLVFTSAHGIRHHRPRPELLDLPVLTVGDRTARAAISVGYRNVRSASGDVRDLEHLVRKEIPVGQTIFHLSARQPAGDLDGNLKSAGYRTRRIVVYETQAVPVKELTAALPPLGSIDGILVHSPRAGRTVRQVVDGSPADFTGTIFCISHTAAAPFAGLRGACISVADRPDENTMLQAVRHRTL